MKAFISYSHKDSELLDSLHEHLSALQRQKLLDAWTDREIYAGSKVDEDIAERIEDSELYLLLVSSAFLQSDYCFEREFARALEREAAGQAIIVPIIVRDCDWKIPELCQFKALPSDGKAVTSRYWHSIDEGFANVAAGLRKLLENLPQKVRKTKRQKTSGAAKEKFVADERHISAVQRAELRRISEEIVDRLAAKAAKQSDEEFKKKKGRYFGIIWNQFNEHFGTQEHGLQSLPCEKYGDAKTWLLHYRASKDKNLKRTNPLAYRNTLTKGIYSALKGLGWPKEYLYAFAAEKVEYANPITSLDDLGINQLELVRDRVRYEVKKLKVKSGQAKARRKPKFTLPSLQAAKEILELIIANSDPKQRGLSEFLRGSPSSPLDALFVPNTTSRGSAATIKKSLFRPAISELIRLGWLLQPEGNDSVRVYELNPEASAEK